MESVRLLQLALSRLLESFLSLRRPLVALLSTSQTIRHSPHSTTSEAKPITPPQATKIRGKYKCIVEYESTPFLIMWCGSQQYPSLTDFSRARNANFEATQMTLCPEIELLWRQTRLLDYGTYASIRVADGHCFPIIKLAHPDHDLAISLITREFSILSEIRSAGLSAIEIDSQPITCHGTIHGYRMKELARLDPGETSARWGEIQDSVEQLHRGGFCHGDLSSSNIMKGGDGHLVLIDLSFAGRIGSSVPPFMPKWRFPSGIYSLDEDIAALKRMSC